MTAGSLLGVALTLLFVLGLMAVALRLLRRYAAGTIGGRGRLPLEIVQRLSLSPRQGIAIVRIGETVLAVSLGEGGVRPLLELTDADRLLLGVAEEGTTPAGAEARGTATAAFAAPAASPRDAAAATRRATLLSPLTPLTAVPAPGDPIAAGAGDGRDFRTLLRAAAGRGAQLLLPLVAVLLLTLPAPLAAQGAAPAATVQQSAGTAAERAAPSTAGVDTMLTRLAPQIDLRVGEQQGGLRLSGTVGVVVMMGLLTLLPTLLLMMTGFTRIFIVLHFLRQALGTQSVPPGQLIAGLALLLTGFVMAPTLTEVNRTALQPWMNGQIEQAEMLRTGVQPFRDFMLAQTRESDIRAFLDMSEAVEPATADDVPLVVLVSAFVTSELRTAFQIGFALFLPFIVIDVVVSSVLMSMGMFMLPPAMISLPFKLLLFVLVDGWTLLVQGLVQSFR